MRIDSLLLLVALAIIQSRAATETYRKLSHHNSKKSKSGKGGKGSDEDDDSSIDFPPYFSSMSIDITLSMSIEMGYQFKEGKGKGSKGAKGSKATKNSKGSKAIRSSKRGSGDSKASKKSSKSDKKSKSKSEKEDDSPPEKGGASPTYHPVPSPRSQDQTDRPPSPIPPAPTRAPSHPSPPTASHVDQPDPALREVKLERYTISYTLSESVMPMRDDYLELEAVTNAYFNDYMLDAFDEPSGSNLVGFRTTLHTSEYRFGEPVVVFYDSTAFFTDGLPTSALPSPSTLETLLRVNLEDPSDYADELLDLGDENAFYFTASIGFGPPSETDTARSSQSSESGANSAAIAAGAVGAALLVAGVFMYRRRMAENEEELYLQKDLNKSENGDATVAGETYAGSTYDGTVSIAPSSNSSSQDEEQGMVNVDLNEGGNTAWSKWIVHSTTVPNWSENQDDERDQNQSNHESDCFGVRGDSSELGDGPYLSTNQQHDDAAVEADEAGISARSPVSRSRASSIDESSTIYDQEEYLSTAEIDSLSAQDDRMSINSGDRPEAESDDEYRPLSVEEIEAMLILNH